MTSCSGKARLKAVYVSACQAPLVAPQFFPLPGPDVDLKGKAHDPRCALLLLLLLFLDLSCCCFRCHYTTSLSMLASMKQ